MLWVTLTLRAVNNSTHYHSMCQDVQVEKVFTYSDTTGLADAVIEFDSVKTEYSLTPISIDEMKIKKCQIPETTSSATGGTIAKTKDYSITDLIGKEIDFIITYEAYTDDGLDGGRSGVAKVVSLDSVLISNFWISDIVGLSHHSDEGVTVTASIDISTMLISIPNQVVGSDPTYGDYDLAVANTDGTPDRTAELTGTLDLESNSLKLDKPWGIYVTSGIKADYCYGLYYNTVFEYPNATMSYSACNIGNDGATETYSFGVVVTQTDSTTLRVKNFDNTGAIIDIKLRPDSVAKIENQYLYTTSYGAFSTYSVTYEATGDSYYYQITDQMCTIMCEKATDSRTISWGEWAPMRFFNTLNYTYRYVTNYRPFNGKIVTEFDIIYPNESTLALSGDGTADSPYLVGTAEEWNTLANYMDTNGDDFTGKHAKLTSDISFSDTEIVPLGNDRVTCFNGELDGNGKTLSGITATADFQKYGIVANITGAEADIHDITVDASLSTAFYYSGGIVGYHNGTLRNAVMTGSVSTTAAFVGGVIGITGSGAVASGCINRASISSNTIYAAGICPQSESYITFTDCGNEATIATTSANTGIYNTGIISRFMGGILTRCYNTGSIVNTGKGTTCGTVAGIAGIMYCVDSATAALPYTHTLIDCYNKADISMPLAVTGLASYALSVDFKTTLYVEGCYNTGNITTTNTTQVSPISGLLQNIMPGSVMKNCWNSGDVTAYSSSSKQASGLFGYIGYLSTMTEADRVLISGCHNSGNISCATQAGGIMGYIVDYCIVDSCYNTGNVTTTASYSAGGIAGYVNYAVGNSVISNCWNSGNITAATTYAGGIIGYDPATDTVKDCFNVGSITASEEDAGGIVGNGSTIVTDCYNVGAVTSSNFAGGIVGHGSDSSAVSFVYNTGSVTCPGSNVGNIEGLGSVNLTKAYYLSANAVECTDTVSVGLSYAELAKLDLGDDWTAGDDYTYPRLTTLADNDYAKAYAAAVVPADGDSYSSITTDFNVGTPDGVTWTASPDVVAFDGNAATFTETVDGTVTLTATCGDVSVTTEITCDVEVEGINDVMENTLEVVEERFYNLAGAQVAEPEDDARAIYIVVKTYSDGTTETVKEVR